MCFTLYGSSNHEDEELFILENLKIAEKDIPVYKYLSEHHDRNSGEIMYQSIIYNKLYEIGETYKQDIIIPEHRNNYIFIENTGPFRINVFYRWPGYGYVSLQVDRGFHSYKTGRTGGMKGLRKFIECNFTVPKGSLYFENRNEIVSDTITFNSVVNWKSSYKEMKKPNVLMDEPGKDQQPLLNISILRTPEDIRNFDFRPYMNRFHHHNWIQYIKYPVHQAELDRVCDISKSVKGKEMYNKNGELVFKGVY